MKNNKYSIQTWNLQFYKIDKNGNELLNEDGNISLFEPHSSYDYSSIADDFYDEDLTEINKPIFNGAGRKVKDES